MFLQGPPPPMGGGFPAPRNPLPAAGAPPPQLAPGNVPLPPAPLPGRPVPPAGAPPPPSSSPADHSGGFPALAALAQGRPQLGSAETLPKYQPMLQNPDGSDLVATMKAQPALVPGHTALGPIAQQTSAALTTAVRNERIERRRAPALIIALLGAAGVLAGIGVYAFSGGFDHGPTPAATVTPETTAADTSATPAEPSATASATAAPTVAPAPATAAPTATAAATSAPTAAPVRPRGGRLAPPPPKPPANPWSKR
jgi:hypothetical protein